MFVLHQSFIGAHLDIYIRTRNLGRNGMVSGISVSSNIEFSITSASNHETMIHNHRTTRRSTPSDSIPHGILPIPDPNVINPEQTKIGMQSTFRHHCIMNCHPNNRISDWANHGICSRGVLLDLVGYHTANGSPLPYDPWSTHGISVNELEAVAKHQGVQFRTGDILLLRVGFIQKYYAVSQAERDALQSKPETL